MCCLCEMCFSHESRCLSVETADEGEDRKSSKVAKTRLYPHGHVSLSILMSVSFMIAALMMCWFRVGCVHAIYIYCTAYLSCRNRRQLHRLHHHHLHRLPHHPHHHLRALRVRVHHRGLMKRLNHLKVEPLRHFKL